MSELRCICTFATDEQWLVLQIVIWFSVAVVVGLLFTLIIWNIQDCLERRRRRGQRHHGRDRRNQPDEGRFEEIRE